MLNLIAVLYIIVASFYAVEYHERGANWLESVLIGVTWPYWAITSFNFNKD